MWYEHFVYRLCAVCQRWAVSRIAKRDLSNASRDKTESNSGSVKWWQVLIIATLMGLVLFAYVLLDEIGNFRFG